MSERRIENAMVPGLGRGGVLAAGAVGASVLTTFCGVLATIIVLRVLPPNEAGRFAFLTELLYSVGLLGSLGQSALQGRLYLQAPGQNDWLKDTWSTIWLTAPLIILVDLAMVVPYQLSLFQLLVLCAGAELFVLTNCFSAILAQQRHYAWSSALVRMGNGFLIIPALLMVINPSLRRLDFMLLSLLLFLGITTLLGGILLASRVPRGSGHINIRQRLSGLVFLVSLLALLIPQRGLIVVAGTMLSAANVAALAALASILRVYDLVGEPAGRVFSTEMARHPRTIRTGLLFAPWLLAALMSSVLLIALPPIVHYLYAGRYDAALPLLPWLVAAGALRLVEIVPRGFLVYVAPARSFNQFTAVQAACAVVGLALMVKCTSDHGLAGTVCAGALIAAARVVVSYVFFAKAPRVEARSLEPGQSFAVEPLETSGENPPV